MYEVKSVDQMRDPKTCCELPDVSYLSKDYLL